MTVPGEACLACTRLTREHTLSILPVVRRSLAVVLPLTLFFVLRTLNATIDAVASFVASAPFSSGGTYDISSRNINGQLYLNVPILPFHSTLRDVAHTSKHPAKVTVPDTYEGSYIVRAASSQAVIKNTRKSDPTGRGRRVVHIQKEPVPAGIAQTVQGGSSMVSFNNLNTEEGISWEESELEEEGMSDMPWARGKDSSVWLMT